LICRDLHILPQHNLQQSQDTQVGSKGYVALARILVVHSKGYVALARILGVRSKGYVALARILEVHKKNK